MCERGVASLVWRRIESMSGKAERGRWLVTVPADQEDIWGLLEVWLRSGRFNPPHLFPVLYMARDNPRCRALLRRLSTGGENLLASKVVVVIEARLAKVLDLCDRAVRRAVGITLAELRDPRNKGLTQSLGVAARRAGFDGIRYPRHSSRASENLAVLMDRVECSNLVAVSRQEWRVICDGPNRK